MPRFALRGRLLMFTLLAGAACPPARAGVMDRLFDFTDAYYLHNGVNPAAISGRRQPIPPAATTDVPFFSFQTTTRALLTLPAYNDSGSPVFFTVLGGLSALSFTNDAAGQHTRQIADSFPE